MFLSFISLSLNGFQWIFRFNVLNANYISFSFVSTILYMFTQTLIMFYLIGAGKKVKELIIKYDLNKDTYKDVLKIKSDLFPPLTLNILLVGTAFVLGGGVQTKVLSKYWHHSIFLLSLIHFLKVILLSHKSLIKNSDILSIVGTELDNKLKNKDN
ncbi:MAG: hypothetical protein CMG61_03970 [Candidatus Marinimicrobia bacterium]|nr:hypothetical protein [Candidatus Neomarinimicrobiota bacterium]|tara:strand:+ start:80157 stop:80624 length:468 start_codon:yes stop_codon:yes gene_type:complete